MKFRRITLVVCGLAFSLAVSTLTLAGDNSVSAPVSDPDLWEVLSKRIWIEPAKWQALIAGLVALGAAIVGFLGLASVAIYNNWQSRGRYERQRDDQIRREEQIHTKDVQVLRVSLMAEVKTLHEFLSRRSKSGNPYILASSAPDFELMKLFQPPETPIFDARRGDLGLLGPEVAGKAARFYTVMSEIRSQMEHAGNPRRGLSSPEEFHAVMSEMDKAIDEAITLMSALKGSV